VPLLGEPQPSSQPVTLDPARSSPWLQPGVVDNTSLLKDYL